MTNKLEVKREEGTAQVPVFMRNYTEPQTYNYVLSYRGFTANLIRRSASSWWIVSDGKWVLTGEPTKKITETNFVKFVDKNYEVLAKSGYIE